MSKRIDYMINSANDRNFERNRTVLYKLYKHLTPLEHDGDHTMGCFELIAASTDYREIRRIESQQRAYDRVDALLAEISEPLYRQ